MLEIVTGDVEQCRMGGYRMLSRIVRSTRVLDGWNLSIFLDNFVFHGHNILSSCYRSIYCYLLCTIGCLPSFSVGHFAECSST